MLNSWISLKGELNMLTASYEKTNANYGRQMIVREIDNENLRRATEIFDEYKKRGVILNDSFYDAVWRLSNQIKNIELRLIEFKTESTKAMCWIGCDLNCYYNCAKAYIAFSLGEIEMTALRGIARTFSILAEKTIDEVVEMSEDINHITGLLQIVPGGCEERDLVLEILEEKMAQHKKRPGGNQRHLADFHTYLKFNEIMGEFWQTADNRQKLFYFPLYFWWNLTAILPLRPTEFLLTPRNCLETGDNGENIITVRRTKLKGKVEKIAYRVEDDYTRKQYTLNEQLAEGVRSYLTATQKMRQTDVETLFLQEAHYKYFGISPNPNSKYYSYANLRTCLRYFYHEVVHYSGGTEISMINLGDTRHIAMVNLIISGGSPMICKELAGHSDIDISSHYYSNISNLVECVTLERYRKAKSGSSSVTGTAKFPLTISPDWYRLPEGWCSALSVKEGDISECLKVTTNQGEIGNCVFCEHYHSDNPGIRIAFFDEHSGKHKVDEDSQYLIKMIELVRKEIGYTEDIGTALLRLQHSSDHYSKCLLGKYITENGGTE